MAFSLSNYSPLSPRLSVSSNPTTISLQSKTLAFHSILHSHHHHRYLQIPKLCFSNYSPPYPARRSFNSSFSVEDSSIDINDKVDNKGGEPNSKTHKKQLPSLKTILQVYKDAILDEDDKVLSDIDAIIYEMEKEKNEFVEKMSALSAEVTSGKEKLIRLQADFDNFRKRSEKERLTIRTDAQGEVIESLLPMVDNFERAKQQLKPETETEKKIDTSYQGIYKQFVEIMRSLRVAVVGTVGKPFDPSLHEAIAREESQEFKEGIIVEEFRRGFLLGGRLLRPAMVKVSAGPGKKKVPVVTEQSATAAGLEER